MTSHKSLATSLLVILVVASLILSACEAVIGEPVVEIPGLAETLAIQTLNADRELSAMLLSQTPNPTSTPILSTSTATPASSDGDVATIASLVTSTPLPTLTPGGEDFLYASENVTPIAADAPCNAAEFIRDVTVPDDMIVKPRQAFTKIWALRNIGKCTWKKGEYALVLIWGQKMGVEPPVPLQFDVVPGQTAELAIDMVAPILPSCWQGSWMLQDGNGNRFGVGPNYSTYFWVSVTVSMPGRPTILRG